MDNPTIHLRADTPEQLDAALTAAGWLVDGKPVQSVDHDWVRLPHPLTRTIGTDENDEPITETLPGAHANCVVRESLPEALESLSITVDNPVAVYRGAP